MRSVTYIRSNVPSPRFSGLKSSWSIHVASLETNLVRLYLTKLGWFKRHTAVEQPVRRCSCLTASTQHLAVTKPVRMQSKSQYAARCRVYSHTGLTDLVAIQTDRQSAFQPSSRSLLRRKLVSNSPFHGYSCEKKAALWLVSEMFTKSESVMLHSCTKTMLTSRNRGTFFYSDYMIKAWLKLAIIHIRYQTKSPYSLATSYSTSYRSPVLTSVLHFCTKQPSGNPLCPGFALGANPVFFLFFWSSDHRYMSRSTVVSMVGWWYVL